MSNDPAGRITRVPGVMSGKPAVRGTRITVSQILRELGAGWSDAQILEAHPHISVEDVRAAESFAAAEIELERILVHPTMAAE